MLQSTENTFFAFVDSDEDIFSLNANFFVKLWQIVATEKFADKTQPIRKNAL